jgi:hypothetical protein
MRSRFSVSLFALLFLGCGPERLEKTEADLAQAVTEVLTRGDTATLRLFIEVPFAYDRVYIAGPRTPAAQIEAAMKSEAWIPEMTRDIENQDHFHLLLFDVKGELIPATLLKRVADFDPSLVGRMYGPDDAWFSVRPGVTGVPVLAALQPTPAPAASSP